MTVLSELKASEFSPQDYRSVCDLIRTRREACEERGRPLANNDPCERMLVKGMRSHLAKPWHFEHFHRAVREPQDWYAFGLEYTGAVIDEAKSTVEGFEVLEQMQQRLDAKENVILLGNHQTEMDPQILSFMLRERFPKIAEEVIFVAGHRVTTDPVAVPFSSGRNLLCIHSKRHIDKPPEQRESKQRHNQRTMAVMRELLSEGGYCIYVAPSGGRDRLNEQAKLELAAFDPQAIEMFYLMARKAKRPAHFHPLTLATYPILPPPKEVRADLGEPRQMNYSPVHLCFHPEFDMEQFPGAELKDKRARRQARADQIYQLVTETHYRLTQ